MITRDITINIQNDNATFLYIPHNCFYWIRQIMLEKIFSQQISINMTHPCLKEEFHILESKNMPHPLSSIMVCCILNKSNSNEPVITIFSNIDVIQTCLRPTHNCHLILWKMVVFRSFGMVFYFMLSFLHMSFKIGSWKPS